MNRKFKIKIAVGCAYDNFAAVSHVIRADR